MKIIVTIFITFFTIALLKLLLNTTRLLLTTFCFYKFKKQPKNINEYAPLVTDLFNNAGTQIKVISTVRSNSLIQGHYDYISNSLNDKESFYSIIEIFYRTKGVYVSRILQSLNLFYWLFLPKYILKYFGKSSSSFVATIINLIYWIVTLIAAYVVENILDLYFKQDIIESIRSILTLLHR